MRKMAKSGESEGGRRGGKILAGAEKMENAQRCPAKEPAGEGTEKREEWGGKIGKNEDETYLETDPSRRTSSSTLPARPARMASIMLLTRLKRVSPAWRKSVRRPYTGRPRAWA